MKKRYENQKIAKNGKPYDEYKLQAENGIYYVSYVPIVEGIQPGSEVELLAEPTNNPKYKRIRQIKTYTESANPISTQAQEGESPMSAQSITPTLQAKWIKDGITALDMAFGESVDIMAVGPVLAELVHNYYGEYVAEKMRARGR